MKRILVTNDDGIYAPGIHALVKELVEQAKYDIRVCAPEKEQSAVSHAITIRKPLYSEECELSQDISSVKACKISGTPADCVRLALGTDIFEGFVPDLVLSGINRGHNSGMNALYSGTVGGALEGTIYGIPSMALSLNHPPTYPSPEDIWPFDIAAVEAMPIIDEFLQRTSTDEDFLAFAKSTVLNLNFPSVHTRNEIKGIKLTQQGCSRFAEYFHEETKSHGTRRCFVMTGELKTMDKSEIFDTKAIDDGWIAITPLGLRFDVRGPDAARCASFAREFHR